MTTEYTKEQMLQLWKRLRWLEPLRADATVIRTDGTDLDSLAEAEMRRWYLELLREGPVHLLPLTEVGEGARLALKPDSLTGLTMMEITPVERAIVRPVRLELEGMPCATVIITDPADPRWRLWLNPYRRPSSPPVALWRADSSTMLIPTDGTLPEIVSLKAVVDPGPTLYRFSEEALSAIPLL